MALWDSPPPRDPDEWLLRAARGAAGRPGVAAAARALSLAGEHGAVWLAAGLAGAAADRARRADWLRATAVVAAAHLASMGLKRVVRRPRPRLPGLEPLVRTAGRHSFPSSHAASSAAAVVAFDGLLPAAPTLLLAAAVCGSRLVVGVHYPSDVMAGAALGGWAAAIGRPHRPAVPPPV
ncbi:phosphatase PAP2 family protein [Streptacidiphilus sp. EB129]|uniref:phosphatase PAP2 family protein n=1 Tax=Streptacidiphilus sp. EB129 TaxID=3156262 RepID=UPI00351878F1